MSLRLEITVAGETPDSVVLSDIGTTYGVRVQDSETIVATAGTAASSGSGGTYYYDIASPLPGATYEYWFKVTCGVDVVYKYGTILAPEYEEGTLGWVRKQLVDQSGRTDLVRDYPTYYNDNGANYYINAAMKRLDRELDHEREAYFFVTVPAYQSIVTFPKCRYVQEVRVLNTEGDYRDFAHSCPIRWWPKPINLAPYHDGATAETLPAAANDVVYGVAAIPLRAVYVVPSDESRTLIIRATWCGNALSADSDKNYWTMEEPNLVICYARGMLEESLQNFSGAAAFYAIGKSDLESLKADLLIEQQNNRYWR